MKRSVSHIVLMWGLAVCLSAATLSQAQKAQIIALTDAVRIALERNAQLRQSQTSAQLDAVAVSEARMQFLPNLGASASGGESFGRNFDETQGRITDQTTRSVSFGVSSGLSLFNGFRDVAALKQAKLTREASSLDLHRLEQTVVFTVAADFLALVQSREQLRVQRENLTAEADLAQQLKQYVEAGARATADLYQQDANVAAARLAVVEAESASELAEVQLLDTLQLDPTGTYDFQTLDASADSPAADERPLHDLVALALSRRADLQAEDLRVQAAEQSLRIAHADYWPSLNLSTGYGTAYTDASVLSFKDQLDLQRGGSVGLHFSIPLFDRHSTVHASRRARLELESTRIRLETAQQQVGLTVRRAQLDERSARERLAAAKAQEEAAERAVQTSQERFKAGVITLIELSQARARYVQAQSARVTSHSNLLFQRTAMDYLLGELDPEQFAVE